MRVSCAYCGKVITKRSDNHRDHVFPDSLYESADPKSKVQRLTVDCCKACNSSWQDDEIHFRNMLVVAGDPPTKERRDLFNSSVMRSFDEIDGLRRMDDLLNQMKEVQAGGNAKHAVFLGEDNRVLRVVRKIIRGLSHYHKIMTAVPNESVWAEFLRFRIPDGNDEDMLYSHRDPNIVEYRYQTVNSDGISSVWVLTFFKSISFVGNIRTADGNTQLHGA